MQTVVRLPARVRADTEMIFAHASGIAPLAVHGSVVSSLSEVTFIASFGGAYLHRADGQATQLCCEHAVMPMWKVAVACARSSASDSAAQLLARVRILAEVEAVQLERVMVVRVDAGLAAANHIALKRAPARGPAPMLCVQGFSSRCDKLASSATHTELPTRVRLATRVHCHGIVGSVEVITECTSSWAAVHAAVLCTLVVATAVNHDMCPMLVLAALAPAITSLTN